MRPWLPFVVKAVVLGAWLPMLSLGEDGLASALPLSSGLYCVCGVLWGRVPCGAEGNCGLVLLKVGT